MGKPRFYILKKCDTSLISLNFLDQNLVLEFSYEDFEKRFMSSLTPKKLSNEIIKKEKTIDIIRNNLEATECYEFIKDLTLKGNILDIESYNLSEIDSSNHIINISSELMEEEQFRQTLALITRTFEDNKNALINQYYAVKKRQENKKLYNESMKTYLNQKKKPFNISQEEAIKIDTFLHRELDDCLDLFDDEYRPLHPFTVGFVVTVPLTIVLTILGNCLNLPNNIFSVITYLVSTGGTLFMSNKVWKKIVNNKLVEFKRDLEEKYHISYDWEQKRVALNNIRDFYDDYTKCVKSVMELAYSKITTSLDYEIESLYSLLEQYQCSGNCFNKAYFTTTLLNIKKQIFLKESNLDNKNASLVDEVSFTKKYISYLTGKNISMLDDEKVTSCLEKIKDLEDKGLYVYIVDLQMGLVEYIYNNYLQEKDSKVIRENSTSNIEYDIATSLEKIIGGK